MSERSDNVVFLDEYRRRAGLETTVSFEATVDPIRVTFKDGYVTALRDEAVASGQDITDVVKEFVSYGLHQREMIRQGWEGPAYKKSPEARGKVGRFMARLGMSETWLIVRPARSDRDSSE